MLSVIYLQRQIYILNYTVVTGKSSRTENIAPAADFFCLNILTMLQFPHTDVLNRKLRTIKINLRLAQGFSKHLKYSIFHGPPASMDDVK
jgi:hypothetical protein